MPTTKGKKQVKAKAVEAADILTGKQRAFVNAYVGAARFNGTQAARLAGYKGNDVTLCAVGVENLRKPLIKAEIDRLMDALTMPSNEVLARLTAIAKGDVTDVLDENGNFSIAVAKQNGKTGLLKKIKRKSTSRVVSVKSDSTAFDDGEVEETTETQILSEEIEFEMYSAHEALRDLGKYHKLFTDRVESDNKNETVNMTVDEWNAREAERIREANETLSQFDE